MVEGLLVGLGERIRALRADRGWTQAELCRRAISHRFGQVEAGSVTPQCGVGSGWSLGACWEPLAARTRAR